MVRLQIRLLFFMWLTAESDNLVRLYVWSIPYTCPFHYQRLNTFLFLFILGVKLKKEQSRWFMTLYVSFKIMNNPKTALCGVYVIILNFQCLITACSLQPCLKLTLQKIPQNFSNFFQNCKYSVDLQIIIAAGQNAPKNSKHQEFTNRS